MNKLEEIAARIIKEQELIIGPIAWSEAESVSGLSVSGRKPPEIHIEGTDPKNVIDSLVNKYVNLFGKAAQESCREASASILADLSVSEIPSTLLVA